MSKLLVGSATDVGLVRSNNQDQLLVAPGLYAVADGMGGHAAGEVASSTAIRALQAAFEASDQHSAESLESAAKAANRAVWEQARTNRGMLGMGTTLVALAVVERDDGTNGLAVAHIGDSRLYLLRDEKLRQLTVDHSLVQELVDDGQISPAQAAVHPQRHVLTRALGVEPAVDVDLLDVSPALGDRYVLCSDGLPREATDDQIAAVLSRFTDPTEAAQELIALAKSRGGSDNITVVVIDVMANDTSPNTLIVVPGPASSVPGAPRPQDLGPPAAEAPSTGPGSVLEATRVTAAEGKGNSGRATAVVSNGPGPAAGQHMRLSTPAQRWVTWRVIGFVMALLIVVGGAIACLGWYARSAYFVTISGGRITVFQGRPGGVLWFQPTVADRTNLTASSVLAFDLPELQAGQLEPSLSQANLYIQRLLSEKKEAEAVTPPSARGAPRPHSGKTTATTTTTATTRATRTSTTATTPTTRPKTRPPATKTKAPKRPVTTVTKASAAA